MHVSKDHSAIALASAMEYGELRAIDVIDSALEAIAAHENDVRAWQVYDAARARAAAHVIDASAVSERGLLSGIPLGVKDIIDTVDFPTTYGSPLYQHHQPARDAACVALARAQGGIVIGKTVTTEFAYFAPGPTANPHALGHTPGGSSSGSAAAVASGMVPLAFGSQTAGSLIRPASYCGIWGFKPSHGVFSLAGVGGMSQTLDTLGWLARHVDDLALMRTALLHAPLRLPQEGSHTPRIAVCRTFDWDMATDDTARAIDLTARALSRAGAQVRDLVLPPICAEMTQAQRKIQAFEAARTLAAERVAHSAELSPSLTALIEEGVACSVEHYAQALRLAADARRGLSDVFRDYDAILAPSAPGEAPEGLAATGDPVFSRMWTLLHVPCLNVPVARGSHGLPVGVQLVGAWLDDVRLLDMAKWIAERLKIRVAPPFVS